MVAKLNIFVGWAAVILLFMLACAGPRRAEVPRPRKPKQIEVPPPTPVEKPDIIVGAARLSVYLPLLEGKRVGIVANHSSQIQSKHLVDSLLALGVDIKRIFSPEHGFRGRGDNGQFIKDTIDEKTKLPVISLYGSHKKPYPEDLEDIDVVLFDLQDVGARFYTYISTLHYVMEACAEEKKECIILDRPNPNGHYVDGPILEDAFSSFVGLHPVPVVHGMTVAEYGKMVNEEGWLKDSVRCLLYVVPCQFYDHQRAYELPLRPSPNLPNMRSIYLYPSLCFFEGTPISVGRGTETPFQIYGSPKLKEGVFEFVPSPKIGASKPKHEGKTCKGYDLSELSLDSLSKLSALNLDYLIDTYNAYPDKDKFFYKNGFFDLLAGTDRLRKAIQEGVSADEIRAEWTEGLEQFRAIRAKYLLYPE